MVRFTVIRLKNLKRHRITLSVSDGLIIPYNKFDIHKTNDTCDFYEHINKKLLNYTNKHATSTYSYMFDKKDKLFEHFNVNKKNETI